MKVTRRDLLVWSAGAAAGLMVTPVPWKVLDDVSIWSQNWPWIPQPTRGPIETKQSACTLCPNGCGMRVRMAAGWPVGISGVGDHPISRGALCPLAFGAHQLNWHPQRLRVVRHRGDVSSWGEAQVAFSKACSEGPIVVVDGYPGRAASSVFETFVQKRNGSYRVVLGCETRALAPYERWSGIPASSLGYDLENAGTIVSFGAALLDGWGPPGRFTRLWADRAAGESDAQLRIIQVESSLSRTAAKAWQWAPVRTGGEVALAAGLGRVLLEDHLVPAQVPMPGLTLADCASQTGLTVDAIRELARTIIALPPVLVIANDDNPAVSALNVLLGAFGARGGIVRRSTQTQSYVSADEVIPAARAVLIDSTVPWDYVPQTDAEVFRFAAWDGGASKSDWLLPAPGFLEEPTDIPTAPTSGLTTYALAPNLVTTPSHVQSATQFLAGTDPAMITTEKIIHARCEEILRRRAGRLYGGGITPVSKVASTQELEEQLRRGRVWVDDTPRPASLRCELKEWPTAAPPKHPENWSDQWPAPVLPPLASKLFQESNLRELPAMRNA